MAFRRRRKKKKAKRVILPPDDLDIGRTFYRPPEDQGIYCAICEKELTRLDFAMKQFRVIKNDYYCWDCAESELYAASGEGKKRRKKKKRRRRRRPD